MIDADSEPAPYVPVVLVLVPAGPRVTPVSMPVNIPGVPTGLQPRGVAKPGFCAADGAVGALAGAVACAAEASIPVVPIAGGQSPGRAATADLAGAPLRSWVHAVRLSVVPSASATVATNAVFCMYWPPISPPGGGIYSGNSTKDTEPRSSIAHDYCKECLAGAMPAAKPSETTAQAWEHFMRDWRALQQSICPEMWAAAGIDEILSAFHEQIVVGSLA